MNCVIAALAMLVVGRAAFGQTGKPALSETVRSFESTTSGDAANLKSDGTRSITNLTSGIPASFALPAQSGATTLYRGDFGFSITVPPGAAQLEVRMQASRDVDLFVNFGSEPELDSNAPNGVRSDYRSITDFSSESIVIPSPRVGTYYVAIANYFRTSPSVTGTVTAFLSGGAVTPPTQFSITVSLGGGSLPPAGNCRVELFTLNGAAVGSPQFADAAGSVVFRSVAPGSYVYRVYNTAGAFGTTEYWGEQSINIASSASSTFVRNMPHVAGIVLVNNTTGQPLIPTSAVATGTPVRAEVSLSSGGISGNVQLRLDRDTNAPYDIDQNCGSSANRVTCTFVVAAGGSYSLAYLVTMGATTTDSGNWRAAFTTGQGEETLVTSAENLMDAAGFQRGNLSPGSVAMLTATGLATELRGCVNASTPVGPFAESLNGVSISLRTAAGRTFVAPLSSVCNLNGRQSVTFLVPAEIAPERVSLSLKAGLRTATIPDVSLSAVSPGVYSYTDGAGQPRALIYRDNGTMVTTGNPLRRGERARTLVIGLGACLPVVASNQVAGGPSKTANEIVVGLGDAGMNVVSAACSSTVPGLYEVTFDVAADAARGDSVSFVVAVRAGAQLAFSAPWPTSVQ